MSIVQVTDSLTSTPGSSNFFPDIEILDCQIYFLDLNINQACFHFISNKGLQEFLKLYIFLKDKAFELLIVWLGLTILKLFIITQVIIIYAIAPKGFNKCSSLQAHY